MFEQAFDLEVSNVEKSVKVSTFHLDFRTLISDNAKN
jgi:hypothetical protein